MSVTFYGDSFELLVTKSVCSILYAENFFDIEIGHQHLTTVTLVSDISIISHVTHELQTVTYS